MINSYTNTSQAVAANGYINFDTNRIETGVTATHTPGTAIFNLNKPGYYYVTFNGTAAATASTGVGAVILQLLANDVVVPGTVINEYSGDTDEPVSMNFTTIIQVNPSCPMVDNDVALRVQSTGIAATFTDVAMSITKLC